MSVISVDLAYKNYRDIGVAVLERKETYVRCEFHKVALTGTPQVEPLADYLNALCSEREVNILLIDGPQAWKHPDNGLMHSRLCERALNTPAKTGLPGVVKPAPYTAFVTFSVEVFAALQRRGWKFYEGLPSGKQTVFETFPAAAWKSLGLRSLPSKAKIKPGDIERYLALLSERIPIVHDGNLTHDDLQALVSGLAGIAYEHSFAAGFAAAGESPSLLDGIWREGFIVNPALADWHARFSG